MLAPGATVAWATVIGVCVEPGPALPSISPAMMRISAPPSADEIREAAIEAVRRIMPRLNLEERTIPPEVLDTLAVTREDFVEALKRVQPSAMREVMVQAPTTRWEDVGGLDEAQERLREGVEEETVDPDAAGA